MRVKNKIPVFIICGKSPIRSYGGGYSTFALNLAKVLKNLHYSTYIVAIGDRNEKLETDYGTLLIFKNLFFDYYTTALPSLPISSWIFANGIKKIINEQDIDKCIVWGIGPWGLAGTILKKQLGKKIIFLNNYFTTLKHEWSGALKAIRIEDYGIFTKVKFFIIYHTIVRALSFFERLVVLSADVIVTNYRSTEQIVQKEFKIPPGKFARTTFLVQVYNRQANEGKKIDYKKLPKKYILYLSRHDPRKGINFLLHAMAILKKQKKHISLVIAGAGQMLEANKRLAKKLELNGYVRFVGFVNNSKALLENAQIFCFPTIEEGAGALIINEAMSLGVPIVSTECDGIKEDIENNVSGILVPVADPKAMAKAIIELYENPAKRAMLGKNAKKKFRTKYNLKKMHKEIENLFRTRLKVW